MEYIGDLHIHSRFSMATSRDTTPEKLELSARKKGILLVGTGDFTHEGWRRELRERLEPAEEGFYRLRPEFREPGNGAWAAGNPRFVVSGEISSIYKKNGRTRKVHNVILLPSFEAADALAARLEKIGNIHSDGRPILKLDCRDLLEMLLDVCPEGMLIPAHIWTPHFSLFGRMSGFDRIEECFEDLTPYVHALETGLSSDPDMNRQWSALDGYQLISNSDAHSPAKLGREATVFDTEFSYEGLSGAIQRGEGLSGTIEFFPQEGKYFYDGHRKCGVCLSPREAEALNGICPVCGKRLTMGVAHRIWELADRRDGGEIAQSYSNGKELADRRNGRDADFRIGSEEVARAGSDTCADKSWYVGSGISEYSGAGFESLVPLPEVVSAVVGTSPASKKVSALCDQMLHDLGTEFAILRTIPLENIRAAFGDPIAHVIQNLRQRNVTAKPGFDGEYGKITVLQD